MADTNHYNRLSIVQSIQKIIDNFNAAGKRDNEYFEDGGYSITSNQVTIQSIRYIPSFRWGTVTYKGTIINDSTILFTEFRNPTRKIYRNDSTYYHFIKTNKPDSLKGNVYKDKKWYWI